MKPDIVKWTCYGLIVACFFLAGSVDLYERQWKLGTVAIGFGIMNALIFFWR